MACVPEQRGTSHGLNTPTADEREALIAEADALVDSWDRRGSWDTDSPVGMVMRLADALRRPEVPEPSADGGHLRGRWSNGDPVHIVTNGVDRWIAPNHNGATWIEDAS